MKFRFWSWNIFWLCVVVTVAVFVAHYFSSFLEAMVVAGLSYAWFLLFVWYLVFIYLFARAFLYFRGIKL